jgi:hypothetical protein
LLEIHADRVIEDVEFLIGFDFFFLFAIAFVAFFVFKAIDLRGIDDIELHVTKALHDCFDVIGIDEIVGEDFVDIVVGEILLLFGKLDELADLFLDFWSIDPALGIFLRGFSLFYGTWLRGCEDFSDGLFGL